MIQKKSQNRLAAVKKEGGGQSHTFNAYINTHTHPHLLADRSIFNSAFKTNVNLRALALALALALLETCHVFDFEGCTSKGVSLESRAFRPQSQKYQHHTGPLAPEEKKSERREKFVLALVLLETCHVSDLNCLLIRAFRPEFQKYSPTHKSKQKKTKTKHESTKSPDVPKNKQVKPRKALTFI